MPAQTSPLARPRAARPAHGGAKVTATGVRSAAAAWSGRTADKYNVFLFGNP